MLKRGEVYLVNFDPAIGSEIRSIDKRRLIRRIGMLKAETMARVDRAIEISFGLVRIW